MKIFRRPQLLYMNIWFTNFYEKVASIQYGLEKLDGRKGRMITGKISAL